MTLIPLKTAHEQYEAVRQGDDPRQGYRACRSYESACRDARNGHVFGITPVKENGRWYVTQADLDAAIIALKQRYATIRKNTTDYENHILHEGKMEAAWGSYTTHGRWHSTYHPLAAAYAQVKHRGYSDGAVCSTCWSRLDIEYGPYQECGCHSCEDWNAGHPGTYPVLSRSCGTCGWKEAA